MKLQYYNNLSLGKIGIIPDAEVLLQPDGISLPICIKGNLQTKTKTMFKPKIPKSTTSKSVYNNIYIRKIDSFNYMYCYNTSIFIASLHISNDVYNWIDKNETRIKERINECTT